MKLAAAAAAASLQSCPTLCDPIDGSPPGSTVPGILQARTLEWVAITLSDPMDCSLPGSSIHGIFQARVLEWGAIAFSLKLAHYAKYSDIPVDIIRCCYSVSLVSAGSVEIK